MITVRRAIARDIPRLNDLLYQVATVHADGRPDLFRQGAKKYSDRELRSILKNDATPVFVAVDECDYVLGYAFCIFYENRGHAILTDITTLYIDDLCVDEAARGKGVGTALYRHVLDFAKQSGCYNVTLNVWACNENARRFYEKCGLSVQKIGMEQVL